MHCLTKAKGIDELKHFDPGGNHADAKIKDSLPVLKARKDQVRQPQRPISELVCEAEKHVRMTVLLPRLKMRYNEGFEDDSFKCTRSKMAPVLLNNAAEHDDDEIVIERDKGTPELNDGTHDRDKQLLAQRKIKQKRIHMRGYGDKSTLSLPRENMYTLLKHKQTYEDTHDNTTNDLDIHAPTHILHASLNTQPVIEQSRHDAMNKGKGARTCSCPSSTRSTRINGWPWANSST